MMMEILLTRTFKPLPNQLKSGIVKQNCPTSVMSIFATT